MIKAARTPETPNEGRNAREASSQAPAKSMEQLKAQIDVKAQTEAQVENYVTPRMKVLTPTLDATFALDDSVRLNPQYPEIADPYRTA